MNLETYFLINLKNNLKKMIKNWNQFNESSSNLIKKTITDEQMELLVSQPSLQKLIADENENTGTGIKVLGKGKIEYPKDVEEIINQYL
jgi:hypothetical protein